MQDSAKSHTSGIGSAKKAAASSAVAVVAVLLATLWPLKPFPKNGVTWASGDGGISFQKAGLVVSKEVVKPSKSNDSQSYTFELLLRPSNIRSSGTIVSFYNPTHSRQLQAWQWRNGLVVTHDASVESDGTQTIKFFVDHIVYPAKLVLIAVSSGRNGATVFVDGKPAQHFPRFKISSSDLSAGIILGTSPVRYDPWNGEVSGLAIYAKELTPEEAFQHYRVWTATKGDPHEDLDAALARYTFKEAVGTEVHSEIASGPILEIPKFFSVPHKYFLQSPVQEFRPSWKYVDEVVMNIAGFVPLGLIISSYFVWTRTRWKAILATTISCGLLSFAIEVMQFYIPRRGSGVTDIVTNTVGAAVGAMLLHSRFTRKAMRKIGLVPAGFAV
jgi:VanZ family protein